MGYSIQNSETGEVDYIHVHDTIEYQKKYDEETGEPILNGEVKVRYVKHHRFQIPKKYLKGTVCEELEKKWIAQHQDNCVEKQVVEVAEPAQAKLCDKDEKQQYKRDDYMKMEGVKNEIILAYKKNNIRLFLIPSLIFFNIYLATLLSILELVLHLYSHMKNGLNMNKKVYYRSPLHVLTSQFCARCRSESELEIKIFKMLNKQMRKAKESKTLKDVSKAFT